MLEFIWGFVEFICEVITQLTFVIAQGICLYQVTHQVICYCASIH